VSLQPGSELDVPVEIVGAAGTSTGDGVPAWLHVVAAWSVTLVGMALIGALALAGKASGPAFDALLVLTGVTGGGGLTLAKPGR